MLSILEQLKNVGNKTTWLEALKISEIGAYYVLAKRINLNKWNWFIKLEKGIKLFGWLGILIKFYLSFSKRKNGKD